MNNQDTPGLASYQSQTFTSDTEPRNTMNQQHHNAWAELRDGIAHASDQSNVLIAVGRAEGYLWALEHSHVIDHAEWRRMQVMLSQAAVSRNEQLSRN